MLADTVVIIIINYNMGLRCNTCKQKEVLCQDSAHCQHLEEGYLCSFVIAKIV